MRAIILIAALLAQGAAYGQSQQSQRVDLSYTYAELRFVDVDVAGGDGFRLNGSFDLEGNWILVGGLTSLDFNNNVDSTVIELGGGYVWHYSSDFDVLGTVRLVRADFDTPVGDGDDNGFALSGGVRGLLTPQFEIRGSVNHVNLDDSDTFLELAGDYYFSDRVAAGISLEFAGDTDVFTIGARWYFE